MSGPNEVLYQLVVGCGVLEVSDRVVVGFLSGRRERLSVVGRRGRGSP